MGRTNQYWAGRVYDLCVYFMTGTPVGSTESGFMEKPRIEPAIPGLQDRFIPYTIAASHGVVDFADLYFVAKFLTKYPMVYFFLSTRVIFYVRRIGLYLYKYRIYGTITIYIF